MSTNRKWQIPGVVFQPATYQGMQRGINLILNAVRPTLGPYPRMVGLARGMGISMPEILDSGGTIARRIIQIQGRNEDVGAMFIRHVLWKQQDKAGDGTATTAVIFQYIYNEGIKYIAAGGSAMRLRYYLDRGLPIILSEMGKMVQPISGRDRLAHLAETICYDRPLSALLGEIFDIIGAYGRLEIRKGSGRELEREYVEGMYWNGGLHSRAMANDDSGMMARLEDTGILISDLEVQEPVELIPVLDAAIACGYKNLVIMLGNISEKALALLISKTNQEKLRTFVVKPVGADVVTMQQAMDDISIITGGSPLMKAVGDTLESVQTHHFGKARRAWADREYFGIIGGKGSPRRLREHLTGLRRAYQLEEDAQSRRSLQERIGKLMGGSATLWVGGITPNEIDIKVELAERTAEAMRGALREGTLPGGGAAFLACRPALKDRIKTASSTDERMAYKILCNAMEEPLRTLLHNAGCKPDEILPKLSRTSAGTGFDVTRMKVVDMNAAGIIDAAAVIRQAAHAAVSSAALALTTDVIIHRADPPESLDTA